MAFATIDVTKGITGTIPVANGGTGLTSGTTGQFLKFTGTTTVASSAVSAGKVLQVQHTKDTGYHAVNSVSFVNVLEVTITPTSSSNSILLIGSPHIGKNTNNTMVIERCFRVVGGSDVATQVISDISAKDDGTGQNMIGGSSFQWYDSPSTTSAITYQYRIASYSDNDVVFFNLYNAGGSYSSQLTAMEISA
jgi:hypothetical protein